MEAPWLEHYDEGVPASVGPYPERTLLDDLADGVAQRPDAPALLFKGRTVTWRRPAVILMSGGTTGTPKGVVGLHRHYTTTGASSGPGSRPGPPRGTT